MSDWLRITLVGASGLIGRHVVDLAAFDDRFRLSALVRREFAIPRGAKIEVMVVDPADWRPAVAHFRPDLIVCALGTTWKKAGRNEEAFRAVDHDLVLDVANAAKEYGTGHFIHISSVGADAASDKLYLRTKGETEVALGKLKFARLDILRPGLLRGERSNDRRALERVGIALSPLFNLFLQGEASRYRAIDARVVARAVLSLATEKARGRFVHHNDQIVRAAGRLDRELDRRLH